MHFVIVVFTCLVLHLSASSISVSSSFITNATCCDTDNCIVLFICIGLIVLVILAILVVVLVILAILVAVIV